MRHAVRFNLQADAEFFSAYMLARAEGLADAVTEASHWIDTRFADDPTENSESREEDVRVAFAYPLTLYFTIDQSPPTASIFRVHYHGHRKD